MRISKNSSQRSNATTLQRQLFIVILCQHRLIWKMRYTVKLDITKETVQTLLYQGIRYIIIKNFFRQQKSFVISGVRYIRGSLYPGSLCNSL